MPLFLTRALRVLTRRRTWGLPLTVITFVFVTSWPLMALAEPDNNPIAEPATYWWWFVVTAATVGYGDFFPQTLGGHLVGFYVIVGGIATLTTLFTRLAEMIESAKGRRMQGLAEVEVSDQVVILGYAAGRTERIVDELAADRRRAIVLCAWEGQATSHPMPGRDDVHFVRGDLTDDTVLRRAGLHRAEAVLVDARDDNEALSITVAAIHVNPDLHAVVALRDMAHARNLSRVDDGVRPVQWHSPRMITEELQDPGIALVYSELMTHGGGATFSTAVPESLDGRTFGDFQQALGSAHAATVLAARSASELLVSPSWGTPVPTGAVLYYVAQRRLTREDIEQAVRR
ncbi:MAG TPA: ion channel [Nocardioidaceae bacterium]|nr:ion channel [Nocardioidaceae bacterium]